MPRTMTVRVTNGYGVVRVDGVKEATVRNRHGELYAYERRRAVRARDELRRPRGPGRPGRVPRSSTATPTSGPSRSRATCGSRRATPASGSRTPAGKADLPRLERRRRRAAGRRRGRRRDVLREGLPVRRRPGRRSSGNNMAVYGGERPGRPGGPDELRAGPGPRTSRGHFVVDAHNAAVEADGRRAAPRSRSRRPTSPSSCRISRPRSRSSAATATSTLQPLDLKHGMDVAQRVRRRSTSSGRSGESARLEARSKGGAVSWGLRRSPTSTRRTAMSLVKAFTANAGAPLIYAVHDLRRHPHQGRRPQVLVLDSNVHAWPVPPGPAIFLAVLGLTKRGCAGR
ncbi:MAG: hypothetical protein M0C28_20995 [Candidatus Moduliflexus flocculans]|nr:hypothetical protein [Candidatus Moduliflexus flocculans]